MKLLATGKFDPDGYKPLNDLILPHRHEYLDYINVERIWEEDIVPFERKEWRHCDLILRTLKNPKYKNYDFIVNTGQNNIITNFNITLESKIKQYMGDHHTMILQGWIQNPNVAKYRWAFNSSGKVELVKTQFPYLNISGE